MPDADFREHTFQRLSEKSKCACELPLMRLSKASFRAVSAALGRVRTPAAYRRSLFQTVSLGTSVNKRRQPPAVLPNYYGTSTCYDGTSPQRFSLRPAWPSPAVQTPTSHPRGVWSGRT